MGQTATISGIAKCSHRVLFRTLWCSLKWLLKSVQLVCITHKIFYATFFSKYTVVLLKHVK